MQYLGHLLKTILCLYRIFFKDFIYLFMRDTEGMRGAETQEEGEAGSTQGPKRDSIPGPRGQALGRRQTLSRAPQSRLHGIQL